MKTGITLAKLQKMTVLSASILLCGLAHPLNMVLPLERIRGLQYLGLVQTRTNWIFYFNIRSEGKMYTSGQTFIITGLTHREGFGNYSA
jgi:hypothetical protein